MSAKQLVSVISSAYPTKMENIVFSTLTRIDVLGLKLYECICPSNVVPTSFSRNWTGFRL